MQIRNQFYGKYLKVDFFVEQFSNDELFALAFGTAKCNETYGGKRQTKFPFYSLHYVHRGKGTLWRNDELIPISEGDLFLIYPDDLVLHSPDKEDPWEIFWINFQGKRASSLVERMNFRHELPRLSGNHEEIFQAFNRVFSGEIPDETKDLIAMSLLDEIIGIVCKVHGTRSAADNRQISGYISDALLYIEQNYFNPDLSIHLVAEFCKIHPSYLSRLFRSSLNVCFSHYLTSLRMQKAKEMLALRKYKINEVAELVGYRNPLYFSKEFKKYIGMPPSDYSGNYTKSNGTVTLNDSRPD